MLEIKGLGVKVGGKEVLEDVNLEIGPGEVHILLGPNGVGKTTLLMAIMGMPGYEVTRGDILFQGESILPFTVEERAKMGIGMAFQKMPTIPGVKLRTLGEIIVNGGSVFLEEVAEKLNCAYLMERSIGLGFSGGEAKRAELFQLFLQHPLLSLIDEPESGVDLDNITLIGKALSELLEREQVKTKKRSGLIITHTGYILEYLNADVGHVLMEGRIVCRGNPRDLFADIKNKGYQECLRCER